MKNKIIYLLVLAATVFFGIMYDGKFLLILMLFEVLFATAMFLMSWVLAYGISIRLEVKGPVASKEEMIPVEIYVKNNCWLPVNHIVMKLVLSNGFSGHGEKERVKGAVQGSSEVRIQCSISSRYCGQVQIMLERIKVYDYLMLFSRKRKMQEKIQVNILPAVHHIEAEVSERTRRFPVEGEEYETHRSGDDPSEIYQVREFRNGDTLQRVHWKLSARTDELMTKEFSMPKGCKILFLLNFYWESSKGQMLDQMNAFLETAVSLSNALAREECPHYVAWYDKVHNELVRKQVENEESFYEMMEELLTAVFYFESYDMEAGYRAEYPGGNFSTVMMLDGNLQLIMNGEARAQFLKEDIKSQLEGYFLQV